MQRDALAHLESDSVHILREAYHAFSRLTMLWSIGKDSTVMLWLARKAFFGTVPFPLVHVDTGYKIPQMIEYRDRLARELHLRLIVSRNEAAIAAGDTYPNGRATRVACCQSLKTSALQAVITQHNFDGVIVGVRRDEEGTRAKERVFSPRAHAMKWNAAEQPPEFWGQFTTRAAPGHHVRIHPLLRWTELDIWEYIARERIPVIPLYFDDGSGHRYRSLGCQPCTSKSPSSARTVADIVRELKTTRTPERAGRAQDQEFDGAFEALRRDGYM